jgi:folate-dependent phosphoribosylglycinamide formyltransferase PurN
VTVRALRRLVGRAPDAAIWRRGHAGLVWSQLTHRARSPAGGTTDRDHLVAAAEWLERAQDSQTDGGVSGRYRLRRGWSSSYPETTGYIVPTFLALAAELGAERFVERTRRAVTFLLGRQLPGGGFPGLEVAENTTAPSAFNTAQIVHGLVTWHAAAGDDRAIAAARRAGDWLVAIQDPDGAWRRHVYGGVAATYSAHASCWLAHLGAHTGESRYLAAASRHLDWVLQHRDGRTGWIDLAGFDAHDHASRHALTHTIAYTLSGVLETSELLGRAEGIESVRVAATGIARRLELSGWLPAKLDAGWHPQATYACLTGNAQLALIWLRLYARDGDARLLSAALKAIDLVKAAQPLHNADPGIRGGIPGSDPVWGGYVSLAVPNWAAKFFVDALLAKQQALAAIGERPRGAAAIPPDVPRSLPAAPPRERPHPLRVVMFTRPGSCRVPQMVRAWSAWNFRPAMVVVERVPPPPVLTRLVTRVRADGVGAIVSRLVRGRTTGAGDGAAPGPGAGDADPVRFCRRHGIPVMEVGPLDAPEVCRTVSELRPDLAVHAGAGILRAPLLALPRLGTLNAHMGILPGYRGMNVAEWATFNGDPVGCAVHLVDAGIDTGDILCVRRVTAEGVAGIRELRRRVDEAQIELLGEVLRYILRTGELPPRRAQRPEAGRQFFRMHPELASILEAEMAAGAARRGTGG